MDTMVKIKKRMCIQSVFSTQSYYSTAAVDRVVIRSVTNRLSTMYILYIHGQLISSGIIKAILTSH